MQAKNFKNRGEKSSKNATFLALLRFYQRRLSALKPPCCRYLPTCSNYALLCFRHRHFAAAFALSAARILRCQPFAAGGFDHPPLGRRLSARLRAKTAIGANKMQKIAYFYVPSAPGTPSLRIIKATFANRK